MRQSIQITLRDSLTIFHIPHGKILKANEMAEVLKREISTAKTLLTKLINKINSDVIPADTLTALYQDACKRFEAVKAKQGDLMSISESQNDEVDEVIADEIIEYQIATQQKLCEIQNKYLTVSDNQSTNNADRTRIGTSYLKMPELKLPKFSDNSENLFSYVQFKSGLLNGLSAFPEMSCTTKFLYLRGQVSGKAYSMIENLAVEEATFETALNILDKEFQNRSEIFIATMSAFMNQTPATNLEAACEVVMNFTHKLHELKNLKYDFSGGEAGMEFVSMILRNKLPKFFTIEIGRLVNNSNPSYEQIIESYPRVRQLLQDFRKPKQLPESNPKPQGANRNAVNNGSNYKQASARSHSTPGSQSKDSSNLNNVIKHPVKQCKFCNATEHFSAHCTKYKSYVQRNQRAIDLKLCTLCLSTKHTETDCPGKSGKIPYACKTCALYSHVTPLCPKMQLNATTE